MKYENCLSVGLNKSQDRKMKDRKMAFGIMPGKLTMTGWSPAPRGAASATKRGKHFSVLHLSVF